MDLGPRKLRAAGEKTVRITEVTLFFEGGHYLESAGLLVRAGARAALGLQSSLKCIDMQPLGVPSSVEIQHEGAHAGVCNAGQNHWSTRITLRLAGNSHLEEISFQQESNEHYQKA